MTSDTLESRIASGCPQCWHPKHGGEQCEGSISTSREASGFGPCPCYACVNGHLVFGALNDDGTCGECDAPDLCPSCNQSIGISVAWCAACAAWFRAVKEGYCTVDPPYVSIDEDLTIGDIAL